jgi:tetratricopeptide (TPR) repeat protein
MPPKRNRIAGDAINVGWGGSIGHLSDMAGIADRLVRWVLSRENVHLYLMCADSVWKLFDALPETRKKRFATGSLADYYNFISHLDIGLAPLEDTPFNRSRSDVKFLEYAAHGVVPVVQATGPYLYSVKDGGTGFFFNSTDELIATLERLADDDPLRTGVSASAREYVLRERTYAVRASDRVEFYRGLSVLKNSSRKPPGDREGKVFACLGESEGAKINGRHLLLGSTRYELLLQGGIIESDPSRAWKMFQEAIQIDSSLYLPYLFGAFPSGRPVQMLSSAIERNPSSIVSHIHLGKAYQSQGMKARAVESFKSAAGIFPEYELPYLECASCLREMGLETQGKDLLKKAIDLIPEEIRGPRDRVSPRSG